MWVKPCIYVLYFGKAPEQYSSTRQENKGEGHLHNHETGSQSFSSAPFSRASRSFVQLLSQVSVRGCQCWHQTAGDSRHEGNQDGKGKHRGVQPDLSRARDI
jgi:hypothetical protein